MGVERGATQRDRVVVALAAAGFEDAQEAGRGGFGVVYRCTQAGLDRLVAVKVLTAGLPDDLARFVREQQAMARLTGHPNIAPVLAVGELEGGMPFLVMPFCERGSVQQRITRLGLLPVDEVLRLGVKMAGALAAAHRLGIVHRDIKPANILLTGFGEPALCDFGIARTGGGFQTTTGVFAGSPAFTAPEVIVGRPPSAASDVYGLGASLFTALTGHSAFERRVGEQLVAQFLRIATEPLPNLEEEGVPEDVSAVINIAMARDPQQRPSAVELGQQLQQLQASRGLPVDDMILHDSDESARRVEAPSMVPAPAPARRRGNVPAAVSGFVGRGEELAQVEALLEDSRLVSVTGIGGIGKTTLATHAARQLGKAFPDGVWLVELAELHDGPLLADVVAAALGIRDQPGRSPTEALVGFLEPRHVLLVLDNCEQLIDQVANLAESLLQNCPRLHILATSREILDIPGEAVFALAPLAVPEPGGAPTLQSLAGYEAVALFVQRARAALPGFALSEANAAAVGRICARLEGLPLAIELAAARLRALTVEEIAEGLSDRFALLTRGRRGAPGRQHTLTGCIEWSYRLCTSTEQHLWDQLSVFAGSFDLPSVVHVCAGELSAEDCLDMLCALVDKSILVRTEHDKLGVRFRLLDTLREYGSARLSTTARHEVHRRHADWYQRLLTQAWNQWFGPHQVQWVHRLGAEMPNIREALQFCLTDEPAVALQMTTHVGPLWQLRGMLSEARRWLDLALGATADEPTPVRIRALHNAVLTAVAQGDLQAAQARITEARSLIQARDDPQLHGLVDKADGLFATFSGEFERARVCYQRAIDNTDDYEIRTTAMYLMGTMLEFLGAHDEAMDWHEKALALAESRGDPYLRANSQTCLAFSLSRRGELQRAEQLLCGALNSFSVLNESWISAFCLEALAWIAGFNRDARRAVVLMAAASALSDAKGTALFPMAELGGWHDECERNARNQLDAAEFEAAWSEGNALTLDQAAVFASAKTVHRDRAESID